MSTYVTGAAPTTIEDVIEAFREGRDAKGRSVSTNGKVFYSYALPIAFRTPEGVTFMPDLLGQGYTPTTMKHWSKIKRVVDVFIDANYSYQDFAGLLDGVDRERAKEIVQQVITLGDRFAAPLAQRYALELGWGDVVGAKTPATGTYYVPGVERDATLGYALVTLDEILSTLPGDYYAILIIETREAVNALSKSTIGRLPSRERPAFVVRNIGQAVRGFGELIVFPGLSFEQRSNFENALVVLAHILKKQMGDFKFPETDE